MFSIRSIPRQCASWDIRRCRPQEKKGGREKERERINEPASEHDHVHGIFPFGDVETRVNRFFSNQNSQSIGAGGSRPLTPLSVPKAPFFFFEAQEPDVFSYPSA